MARTFLSFRSFAVAGATALASVAIASQSAHAGDYCYPTQTRVVHVQVEPVYSTVRHVYKPVEPVCVPVVEKVYVPVKKTTTVVETVRVYPKQVRYRACY